MIFLLGILSCKSKTTKVDAEVYYTCSMDPQVISDRPGNCPICKMELTAVRKSTVKLNDDLQLSDQQIRLANILIDTIGLASKSEQNILLATVNLDGTKQTAVTSRVMGRIEKLFVKNVGDFVNKGMPLYEIYSEELNIAKQEYLIALQRRSLFNEQTVIDFEDVIGSAKNKLSIWLSQSQIKELTLKGQASPTTTFYSEVQGHVTSANITEGSYIMEGGSIIEVADLSSLWVDAQVYPSQLFRIPRSGTAIVQIPDAGVETRGTIEFTNPELTVDSRISMVRVKISNIHNKLRPGMSAYVILKTAERESIWLPTVAVIREKKGATVWLKTGPATFRSQMVSTGLENDGIIEIVGGLKQGDLVVFSGAYLLHSEFRFKRGLDPMAGHTH